MPLPRVSIITSTYNRSAVLRRAIASVRAQRGFADWEMCIVGDCTPDDSEAVVAAFGDPRLRFYNLPVKSPPVAHGAIAKNHGIFQMARAPYIAYLDDDDESHPDFLRIMMGAVARQPGCAVFYCRCQYRDKKTGRKSWGILPAWLPVEPGETAALQFHQYRQRSCQGADRQVGLGIPRTTVTTISGSG